MRKFLPVGVALLFSLSAEAIKVGNTRADVTAELGAPMGELDLGDRTRLMYEAGDVTLVDGVVAKHTLMTDAELERDRAVREKMAEQAAARAAQFLADRLDKGRVRLDYLQLESTPLTDQDIQAMLIYWKKISADFPDADVDAEYEATLALAKARADEIKQRAEDQRIAQLEQRVAAAEQRAASAEQAASQTSYMGVYTNYVPAYYYPSRPVVIINDDQCAKPVVVPGGNGFQARYTSGYGLSASYSDSNVSVSFQSPRITPINRFPTVPSRPITIVRTDSE